MNPRETEALRQALIERLTSLYRTVHAGVRASMVKELFDQDEPRDEADEAKRVELRDLRMRLTETDALRAQQIEEALRRITRGDYGRCADCGEPINGARLRLLPWTLRCVECQEAAEWAGAEGPPSL